MAGKSSNTTSLSFDLVKRPDQLRANVKTFATGIRTADPDLVRRLVATTSCWVFDPEANCFGPGKFVGYVGMDFGTYERAKKENWTAGSGHSLFHGGKTKKAIAKILDPFAANEDLRDRLADWLESELGKGVVAGVDTAKWIFTEL